ncbi:hypothetical protein SLS55_002800 [Diplodia seriata]|uniref:Uncharacterized protein n=1 Tax=Diplodia seriata TaxID=420778 RepID=A0ABR3CL61_9PEZI
MRKIRIMILKHSLVANEPFDLAAPTKLLPFGPSWQKFQSMRDDTLHVPRLNKTIRNEAAEIFYGASNTQHLRKLTANLGFARAPWWDPGGETLQSRTRRCGVACRATGATRRAATSRATPYRQSCRTLAQAGALKSCHGF